MSKTEELQDLLESAWVLIANAYGGDWDLGEASGWKAAAERWRDEYHASLPEVPRRIEQPLEPTTDMTG